MLILSLSLGCASEQQLTEKPAPQPELDAGPETEAEPADSEEQEDDAPSEYIYDAEEADEALLSAGEIEESIREVLEVVVWTNPMELTAFYEDIRLDGGDDDCPYYYKDADGENYYGHDYWYDSCTAGSGSTFSGYALSYSYEPYVSGSYIYDDQAYLSSYGSITDRLGNVMDLSGSFYHYSYGHLDSATRYGYAYLIGDARWSSEEAADTWLASEYSLNLTYSWGSYPSEGGYYIDLVGSISGLTGVTNAALFEAFYLSSASIGSDCELEPSGTLSVRDAAGEWYHVEFQGPAWSGAPVFTPECDGCGDAFYRGEFLGEVCPDFSPITQWENRPWQ
jgi:hypothetical protein